MKTRFFPLATVLVIVMIVTACSSNPQVARVDSDTRTDLSGYWNDSDVRIVCEYLVNDFLSSPRVNQTIRDMGGKTPVVIIGRFRNESDEHIDTAIISSTMGRTIFNSRRMTFVAEDRLRDELRAERQDQLSGYTSDETAALLGKEIGADFLLTGTVRTIVDQMGNQTVRTYYVDAEMTSIETNEHIWMGHHSDIKKVITRPRNRL